MTGSYPTPAVCRWCGVLAYRSCEYCGSPYCQTHARRIDTGWQYHHLYIDPRIGYKLVCPQCAESLKYENTPEQQKLRQEQQRANDYFVTRQAETDLRASGIPTVQIHNVKTERKYVKGFLGFSSSWRTVETLVGTVRGWVFKSVEGVEGVEDEHMLFTALPDASEKELAANGFSIGTATSLFRVLHRSSGYVYYDEAGAHYTHDIIEAEADVKRLLATSKNSSYYRAQAYPGDAAEREYFVSGAAREALVAAGVERVALYRENYRRLAPGRLSNSDEPEVVLHGYGWLLGDFTWITPVYEGGRWESRPVISHVALSDEPTTNPNRLVPASGKQHTRLATVKPCSAGALGQQEAGYKVEDWDIDDTCHPESYAPISQAVRALTNNSG